LCCQPVGGYDSSVRYIRNLFRTAGLSTVP
jgi:hypothetical protein